MLEEGLLEEVQKLKSMGYHRGMVSMQGLGYKEILAYLDGEYPLEEAVRILKRDTRHFAKRQLTWFRREKDTIWMNKDEFDYREDRILDEMLKICRDSVGIHRCKLYGNLPHRQKKNCFCFICSLSCCFCDHCFGIQHFLCRSGTAQWLYRTAA